MFVYVEKGFAIDSSNNNLGKEPCDPLDYIGIGGSVEELVYKFICTMHGR